MNSTTTLTWTADKGLGTHGGYRADGWELVIMRDQNRHYTLWGPDDCGEKGYLCKGSLAKCKARAEELAAAAPLTDAEAAAALDAAVDALAQPAEDPRDGSGVHDENPQTAPDMEPTPEEVDAAYDRSCSCLPEIEAATARRRPSYDAHLEQEAREQLCSVCGFPNGEHGPNDVGPEGECLVGPTSDGVNLASLAALAANDAATRTPDVELDPSEREDQPEEVERNQAVGEALPYPMPVAERRTGEDTQSRVNRLVWEHGLNVVERADREELLAQFDLGLGDLSDTALERARQFVTERTYQTGPLVWGQMETITFTGSAETAEQWRTKCGRYRILRVLGADPRFSAAARVNSPAARERHIGNARNLGAALDLVAAYHARLLGEPTVDNASKVLKVAERNGSHKVTRPPISGGGEPYNNSTDGNGPDVETITRDGRTVMQISDTKARTLLAACGVPENAAIMAPKNAGRLQKRLNDAAKMAGYARPEDAELGGLYDEVLGALEAGTEVTVKAAGKKAGQAKPQATGKKADKTSPRKPEAAGSGEVDSRGFKGRKAEIMAILEKARGPLTVKEVREAGGIPGSYRDFFDALAAKKVIKGDHEKGWMLVK